MPRSRRQDQGKQMGGDVELRESQQPQPEREDQSQPETPFDQKVSVSTLDEHRSSNTLDHPPGSVTLSHLEKTIRTLLEGFRQGQDEAEIHEKISVSKSISVYDSASAKAKPSNGSERVVVSNNSVVLDKYDGSAWQQQWRLGGPSDDLSIPRVNIGSPPDTSGGLNINKFIHFNIAGNDLRYITDELGRNLWTLTLSNDGTFGSGTRKGTLRWNGNDEIFRWEVVNELRIQSLSTGGQVRLQPTSGDIGLYNPTYGTEWQLNVRNGGELDFMNGSTRAVRFNTNNNVGFGTAFPSEKVHILGNIRLSGDIHWTNGEITSNDNNTGARIIARATNNPNSGDAIFAVESVGNATRFGVTQDYGGWFRDALRIGYAFDSGGLNSPPTTLDVAGVGKMQNVYITASNQVPTPNYGIVLYFGTDPNEVNEPYALIGIDPTGTSQVIATFGPSQ